MESEKIESQEQIGLEENIDRSPVGGRTSWNAMCHGSWLQHDSAGGNASILHFPPSSPMIDSKVRGIFALENNEEHSRKTKAMAMQ